MIICKLLLAAIFSFVLNMVCPAQSQFKPISIGEKLPEQLYLNFLEAGKDSIRMSQFHNKIIILDFWDIWCSSCFKAMPKLDALQRKFRDEVRIILITKNSEKQVKDVFSRIKLIKPELPFVVSDTLLHQLFPHKTRPHYVIIDQQGRFKYATSGYNINEANIRTLLLREEPRIQNKLELVDFDPNQPLWTEGQGRLQKNLLYYSFFMKRITEYNGARFAFQYDTINNKVGIKVINMPVLKMYQIAFSQAAQGTFDDINRIIFETDATHFFTPSKADQIDEWRNNNLFSYELVLPVKRTHELFSIMQKDVNMFFDYNARVEKRNVKCLALIRITENSKLESKSNKAFISKDSQCLIIRNSRISSLVSLLNQSNPNLSMPLLDLTNFNKKIDIKLTRLEYSGQLRKELQNYGLDLTEIHCDIDMLVIRKKSSVNF